MSQDKTRILERWETEQQGADAATRIIGDVPAEQLASQLPEAEPALPDTLNPPPTSPWPGRLGRSVLALVLGGAAFEWGRWTLDAWNWQPLAGVLLGGLGLALAGTAALAWRDIRRQRLRLTELEQLRREMQLALREPGARLSVDWLERLQALYRDTPLAQAVRASCATLDVSHSPEEVRRRLNQEFYQALDLQARQLIRRESTGTGMLVATSPWVAVDLLLVVWRNVRMMQKLAQLFGIPMGQLGRWRLARHVLRNIALAGGTEMAIGALSDSLLSGLMEKLAARVGQGIGVGLYSSRLGHFTLDLCRAVPADDQGMLAEDNRGIIQAIRERLTGGKDGG